MQRNVEKLQIIGIDNDRALAQPFVRKYAKKKQINAETKEVTKVEVKYHYIEHQMHPLFIRCYEWKNSAFLKKPPILRTSDGMAARLC